METIFLQEEIVRIFSVKSLSFFLRWEEVFIPRSYQIKQFTITIVGAGSSFNYLGSLWDTINLTVRFNASLMLEIRFGIRLLQKKITLSYQFMLQYDWMEIQKYKLTNVVWYCGSVGYLRKTSTAWSALDNWCAVMKIDGAETEDKVTEQRSANEGKYCTKTLTRISNL